MPTPEIFFDDEIGQWFPIGGLGKAHRWHAHHADSAGAIQRLPRDRRRTVVQAGTFQGAWAIYLSGKFQRVVTFEPEEANWICLNRNFETIEPKHRARIEPHHAALGSRPGTGKLLRNSGNPGGHKFLFEDTEPVEAHGKFTPEDGYDVVTIDQYELQDVDAIFLDLEGAELLALMGAEKTLERCRPGVILCEVRGHEELHGFKREDLWKWLGARGYRHAGTCRKDQMFVP